MQKNKNMELNTLKLFLKNNSIPINKQIDIINYLIENKIVIISVEAIEKYINSKELLVKNLLNQKLKLIDLIYLDNPQNYFIESYKKYNNYLNLQIDTNKLVLLRFLSTIDDDYLLIDKFKNYLINNYSNRFEIKLKKLISEDSNVFDMVFNKQNFDNVKRDKYFNYLKNLIIDCIYQNKKIVKLDEQILDDLNKIFNINSKLFSVKTDIKYQISIDNKMLLSSVAIYFPHSSFTAKNFDLEQNLTNEYHYLDFLSNHYPNISRNQIYNEFTRIHGECSSDVYSSIENILVGIDEHKTIINFSSGLSSSVNIDEAINHSFSEAYGLWKSLYQEKDIQNKINICEFNSWKDTHYDILSYINYYSASITNNLKIRKLLLNIEQVHIDELNINYRNLTQQDILDEFKKIYKNIYYFDMSSELLKRYGLSCVKVFAKESKNIYFYPTNNKTHKGDVLPFA